MAKMKPQIDSTIVETQNEIQENPANMDLSAILARLDEQDKLIKELKKDGDENLKKEIYKGPRKYSFKIFDGKPILSYKSFKKDNTRDWKFKTLQGQEVINHWLTLSLWDFNENKIVSLEVSYDNFNDGFTYSEKMFCDVKSDGNETTGYEFTTVDFGKFTVLPNSIN